MISLTSPSPSLSSLLLQPPFQSRISTLKTLDLKRRKSERNPRIRRCRAELSQDAPFALAIGACVLNSLIFPIPRGPDEPGDGGSAIDSTDTRFAVMGIVSFIPYFNWLSWVFAWLDTSSRRYLVYSIVYLAPYLRAKVVAIMLDHGCSIALKAAMMSPESLLIIHPSTIVVVCDEESAIEV